MAGERNQSTRLRILRFLKTNGDAAAKDVARHCELTTMAVSRHLLNLQAECLVDARTERRPRGRPTTVYSLTEAGDAEFPREYGALACELLIALEQLDGAEKVDEVFRKRREEMTARYRKRVQRQGIRERVEETAAILTECGFMADVTPSPEGGLVLTERNCAIRGVAECFPAACHEEMRFLRALIGVPVQRVTHLVAGDRNCSYFVTLKNGAAVKPVNGDRRATAKKQEQGRRDPRANKLGRQIPGSGAKTP